MVRMGNWPSGNTLDCESTGSLEEFPDEEFADGGLPEDSCMDVCVSAIIFSLQSNPGPEFSH